MSRKHEYIINEIYNKLQLIELYRKDNKLRAHTKCVNCGKEKDLRACDLYNNKMNSCRCMVVKHGMHKSKIYSVYHNIKDRCLNPRCHAYKNYGGRGIKVCEEWLCKDGFINFNEWANNNGYSEGLSIDRIDIDGDYEPNNCRWITKGKNTALSNIQHPRIKKKKK